MPVSLEALTLTLSGFMSGYDFSGAWVFTPAVAEAPSPLIAKQWKHAWDIGRIVGKSVVTGSAASFAYLAYGEPVKHGNPRFQQLLSLAAIVIGAIVPFTIISSYPFNEAINKRLGEIDGDIKVGKGSTDLKQLVVDWGRLDFYRTILAISGTFIGIFAVLL
ncbi:hypothetical protein PFICI_09690 [Pestalotiopsis fici W106-1]|uniref:DUF1772-domain-containing protein n=1 Tax=Pestalotiopsis fici (strain W106-1 / CGMCC3.15140) TaxID=1229662 RepID=W3WUS6_PESFW|nr:uncharacterized protein PFICI_09690 [Pestalotiopsis fici W106-1]ETS77628.1 hypothetical protein PFICI_09690 [Pestalotiopsis fici W106-1]